MNFPLVVDLRERLCLVVGSSEEAAERVGRFVDLGAKVRWVGAAPESGSELEQEREASSVGEAAGKRAVQRADAAVERLERPWQPADLDDVWLVVLGDRDAETAASLKRECDARRLFFCAIDQPTWNSFNHVSVIRQGPLQIAISTGGVVPALARRMRVLLERLLGDGRLARFADVLAELRDRTPPAERKQLLEQTLSGLNIDGQLVVPEKLDEGESTN